MSATKGAGMTTPGDWVYLSLAFSSGGACSVPDPEARAALQRAGYMTPAKVRGGYYWGSGNFMPHAMALTKAGQKRAKQIKEQSMTPQRRRYERSIFHHALQKSRPWWLY